MADTVDLEKVYKYHREGYDVWVQRAKYITARCEAERRDMTDDETKRFDECMAVTRAIMGGTDADKRYLASVGPNGGHYNGLTNTSTSYVPGELVEPKLPCERDTAQHHRAGRDPDDIELRHDEDLRDYYVRAGRATRQDLDTFRPAVWLKAKLTGDRTMNLNAAEKRALDTSEGAAGGVPAPLEAEFVRAFIERSSIFATRARRFPMESKTLTLARVDGLPTAEYKAENAAQTATDLTLSSAVLDAETVRALTEASEELVSDSINFSEMVVQSLSQSLAEQTDAALLNGDGTGANPLGLLRLVEAADADGVDVDAVANWSMYSQAVDALRVNKLTTPMRSWEILDGIRTAGARDRLVSSGAGADGQPLRPFPSWDELGTKHVSGAVTEVMAGTAGSRTFSAGTDSMSLVGDFSFVAVGIRLEVTMDVDRSGDQFASYSVRFRGVARNDVQLLRPQALVPIFGISAS